MLQDQRSTVELLYKVSREFATALDLKTVLTRVLFAAINNVGGERGSVVVLDDNGEAVESAIVYGNQLRENTTRQLRETVEHGLAGWVVRNRKAALVPDTTKDSRWLRREDDALDRSGAKSSICAPLLVRDKLVGVLTIVHPVPGSYGNDHLELMQAIADQAGVAVLNARLYAESQRQARVMTALAESAVELSSSLHTEDVFEHILAQTKDALQVETVVLGLVEAASEDIVFCAAAGTGADKIKNKRVKAQEGVVGIVMREGRGIFLPIRPDDTSLAEGERIPNLKIRAVVCGPIHVQGQVIGVIEAFNPTEKILDPDALLVLTGLGSLAGTSIQNAQLFESLDATRKRYRDLFEDSIDPIVITDLQGKIIEVNRQASQLSGHSAEDLRQFLIEQMHEVNFGKTGRKFEKLSESATMYESTLYDKDGGTHPVEVYARKVEFNEAESIQWILRDISVRKDLDALREDLAAMIYHDVRSPLANVVSSIELLSGLIPKTESDSAEPVLRIARNSIARIQRLISSLLDLNRLEQNQPVGQRQAVTVDSLLKDALEVVAPVTDGRDQNIQLKLSPNLPKVLADEDMIRRVLINLLENAAKYTPSKGNITSGAVQEDNFVRFYVEDDGPGIPENDRERIFDKFTRLKARGGPGGLGVGLAFCKLAVQGHGGKIWVEEGAEKGSRFIFTLPVAIEG